MNEDKIRTKAMELIQKLRYMGRQYAAGQEARGGGAQKHYLEEAADELERLSERDKQWFTFAMKVGERVKCLASSFPDSNDHILRKMEAPVRHLVSVSSIDIEKMLAECVPGGQACDPQQVADNIRRYCDAWPSA